MALNDLIANSGERFYENARKGFYETPEEQQASRLNELKISGAEQQQTLRNLQIQGAQNTLSEYDANSELRDLERTNKLITNSPEYIAQQAIKAEEERIANLESVRAATAKDRQALKDAKTGALDKERLNNQTRYTDLITQAATQTDDESAIISIKQNKDSLIKYGDDNQDQIIEAILGAPKEEQAQLLKVLRDGLPALVEHRQELEKEAAKAAAKSPSKSVRPSNANKQQVADAKELISNSDVLNDLSGWDGAKERGIIANAVVDRAEQIQAEASTNGEPVPNQTEAMSQAIQELEGTVNEWWDGGWSGGDGIDTSKMFGGTYVPTDRSTGSGRNKSKDRLNLGL